MANNPFLNSNAFGNPYMPKSPQQLQNEMSQMQNQYAQQYNSYMQQLNQNAQNVMNNPMGNGNMSNPNQMIYTWKYQEQDNEIENLQIPANGNPFMLVGNGVFYIKKFVNGQPYVSAYSFQPLNNVGEPKNNKQSQENDLKAILTNICDRLDRLEGNKEKTSTNEN